jgi:Domain of unknown function (DUF1905)
MKKLEFTAKIAGREIGVVAALAPPFDVVEVFGTRARVPVRGTINGYPFRSSLMPMGDCLQEKGSPSRLSASHMMPVCKALRDGAGVKPGDTVSVVMERDEDKRIVEVPPPLKKELAKSKTAQANWKSSRSRIRKRLHFRSAELNRKKPVWAVSPKPWIS